MELKVDLLFCQNTEKNHHWVTVEIIGKKKGGRKGSCSQPLLDGLDDLGSESSFPTLLLLLHFSFIANIFKALESPVVPNT